MEPDDMRRVVEQFNSGAPMPTVEFSDIKQTWPVMKRMVAEARSRPNVAIGLGAYAAAGVDVASRSPVQMMAVAMRQQFLNSLLERGVLSNYVHGDDLNDEVFLAAASMPFDKEDLAEALLLLKLSQDPAEIVAEAKEKLRQQGYDPDHPRIDAKFLAWLRERC